MLKLKTAPKYGFPLRSYSELASNVEHNLGRFETNTFYHNKKLVDANFTSVVRPNVDTYVLSFNRIWLKFILTETLSLYSEALVDLSSENVIVTIPKVPSGRFYVFPIYDM
jgi:hypothetical protein